MLIHDCLENEFHFYATIKSHNILLTLFMTVKKEKVILIIPTYNEALIIAETIRQVFTFIRELKDFDVEVLVFDSASTDKTQEIIRHLISEYGNILHLQAEPRKTGLGSAYLQAMNYALYQLKADIVIEFDADLSHQPKYIAPMLETLKTCDVVVGSRYVKGGSIPQNWEMHRKILSLLGNSIARLLLTRQYKDLTSGFRITRHEILKKVLPKKFLSDNYAYKLHLMWLLHQKKANIKEFPIEFIDRTQGLSKLPTNSIIDALRVIFTLRFTAIKKYLTKLQS